MRQVFYEEFDSFYYYSGSTQNWEMQDYHFHKEYEVILFLCDGASIAIGGRVYTMKYGDLCLIHNREYHKTMGAEGKEYKRYVLMFDPDFVTRIEAAMNYDFTKHFVKASEGMFHKLHLSGTRLGETIELFKRVESCSHSGGAAAGKISLQLKILELLLHIDQMYDFFVQADEDHSVPAEEMGESQVKERIEQIKKYIGVHVDEKLEQEDIARKFFISKSYLSHYFKKETGFTLGQYITNRKISKAKDMLRRGFSVTETAIALSYQSDSHFIHTFRQITGTTPKKYAMEKEL